MSDDQRVRGPAGLMRRSVQALVERGELQVSGNLQHEDGCCNGVNRFGRYCASRDLRENGRCRYHQGQAAGVLHPKFKHGRYSTGLPQGLEDRIGRAAADPDRLGYEREIMLIDARISELIERAPSGESGEAWKQLHRTWKEFEKFRAAGDVVRMQALLEEFGRPLREGLKDHLGWSEIGEMLDRRARFVELERKRLEQLSNYITADQAMTLIRTVFDVISRHVSDQPTLDAIGAELEQLVTLDAVSLAQRAKKRRA